MSNRYFLRSSQSAAVVECHSWPDAAARLRDVIRSQKLLGSEVLELPSGRWLIRNPASGGHTAWIEDENGMTVLLAMPPAQRIVKLQPETD
jgi:hypothetical protein